jgi:hypothetical protein
MYCLNLKFNPLSKVLDDTIRIMLATDNHIGYNERDPIRGQDSINTFKEILQLAVKYDVSGAFNIQQYCSSNFRSLIISCDELVV